MTRSRLLTIALLLCVLIGITDYRIMGFALVGVVSYLAIEWGKVKFPRWILLPWAVIAISAFAHMVLGHNRMDIVGMYLVLLAPLLYLAGQALKRELGTGLAVLGGLASITTIVVRIVDHDTIYPSILAVTHITAFIILMGLVFTPERYRLPLTVIAIPAVILSGSEEGILALGILGVVALLSGGWHKKYLISVGATAVLVGLLVPTGILGTIYPRLGGERFASLDMDNLTHLRWGGYSDMIKYTDWKLGNGYYWQEVGSGEAWPGIRWQTTHNVPLRIMSQYGLVAGMAWFAMMLYGLYLFWGSKYRYMFLLILVFGMIHHMLWTYLVLMPWVLMGAAKGEEKLAYEWNGGSL